LDVAENPYQTPACVEPAEEPPLPIARLVRPIRWLGLSLVASAAVFQIVMFVVLLLEFANDPPARGDIPGMLFVVAALSFVNGTQIVSGWHTWRLRSRRWANFGCVIGVLTCVATMPLAIWASWRLHHPGTRKQLDAVFQRRDVAT
jgi:hypothetical protein